MILIFLPLVVYTLLLLVSLALALFVRRYIWIWRLCPNKPVAFIVGAIVFLIVSKIVSIVGNLLLYAIAISVGPEVSNLLGILAFSYGEQTAYFLAITKSVLLLIVSYKYLSIRSLHLGTPLESEAVAVEPKVTSRFLTGISGLVFLVILLGPFGPLYGTVTVPARVNLPMVLATYFHQPRLCLLMPTESFNEKYIFWVPEGIQCLRNSQTEKEYLAHCDLIPSSMREGWGITSNDLNPYQECVTKRAEMLAKDTQSSLTQDEKASVCEGISDLYQRAVCLLPYSGTSAWTRMCDSSLSDLRKGNYDNNATDAILIGKCLNEKTVNELDGKGRPFWFNYHILTGYTSGTTSITNIDILSWLYYLGLNPKVTDSKGRNFLSVLLDSHPESGAGQTINEYDIYTLLDRGLGIEAFTQKDKEGLSSIDYAFMYRHMGVMSDLVSIWPDLKGYKPSDELVSDFLETCHTGSGDLFPEFSGQRGTAQDKCFRSDDERARQAYLQWGLLE